VENTLKAEEDVKVKEEKVKEYKEQMNKNF
jgi:hypothetical protein